MNKKIKIVFYIILCMALIFIDQIIKLKVRNNFSLGQSKKIVPGFFDITYIQNRGAAFGMLQDKQYIFLIFSVFAIGLLIYMFFSTNSIISKTAITVIIAGAVGNIIDRVKLGYVVDMFDFHAVWKYVFNFADICVVLGVIMLSINILMTKE